MIGPRLHLQTREADEFGPHPAITAPFDGTRADVQETSHPLARNPKSVPDLARDELALKVGPTFGWCSCSHGQSPPVRLCHYVAACVAT